MAITGTELVGLIGTFLVVLAYIPQIRHIVREHCAGGVSLRAWGLWLVATVLISIYALTTLDLVFITLQAVSITAIIVVLILIKLYGKRVCHSKEKYMKKK